MDTESAALATTAATTVVTLLTTDAWAQVKKTVEADLAEAREEALAGGEAVTGTLVTEWDSAASSLAFSPDGHLLAADGLDYTITFWSVQGRGKLLTTFDGHRGPVGGVAFSPDGGTLASASNDGTITLWHTPGTMLDGPPILAGDMAFSPDGHKIAIGTARGFALVYAVYPTPSNGITGPFPVPATTLVYSNQWISGVAFAFGGGTVITAGHDGAIRLFDIASSTLVASISTGSTVYAMSSSPRGLLATTANQAAILWLTDPSQLAASIRQTLKIPSR